MHKLRTPLPLTAPYSPFLTPRLQLCPLFPHDQDTFNFLLSPAAVMSYKDKDNMKNVKVNTSSLSPLKL